MNQITPESARLACCLRVVVVADSDVSPRLRWLSSPMEEPEFRKYSTCNSSRDTGEGLDDRFPGQLGEA
jgi:hypothetical protein